MSNFLAFLAVMCLGVLLLTASVTITVIGFLVFDYARDYILLWKFRRDAKRNPHSLQAMVNLQFQERKMGGQQ